MPSHRPIHRSNLEKITQWHVAIYVIAAAWMFGGRIGWARPPLIVLGAIGAGITVMSLVERRHRGAAVGRWLLWLLPAGLLALWVLLSTFNPSMEFIWIDGVQYYQPVQHLTWLPSSAYPALTLSELGLMLGCYLAAFNLALNSSQLRTLHHLMLVLGINALVLALFGTVQKMAGTQMFFGLQESPNKSFFASFIYHNHWGPFVLLNIAGWFGLMEYLSRRDHGRGFVQSPAMAAVLAVLFLAVTLPLSTSRSATAMVSVLIPVSFFWILWREGRHRTRPIPRRWLISIGVAGVIGCAGAVYWAAGDTIRQRLSNTRDQISYIQESGTFGQRARLYQDTWDMIMMRPISGWGLETYSMVYRRYNTEPKTVEGWTVQFNEAHSDWLQLWLETGLVGLLLLLACLGIPLWALRHRLFNDPFPGCLLLCLLLLSGQAIIEFPFASPAVVLSAWVAFFAALRYLQLHGERRPAHHSRPAHG